MGLAGTAKNVHEMDMSREELPTAQVALRNGLRLADTLEKGNPEILPILVGHRDKQPI